MSVAVLALPHGTRQGYRLGCLCLPCRAANAAYTAACRKPRDIEATTGDAPYVEAEPVRVHLEQLRTLGVGYRQAAKLAGVSRVLVLAIRKGTATRVGAPIAEALLGVKAQLAHGQRVPGWRTWRLIDSLEREGFTRTGIARRLGLRAPQLQLHHRRVTVRNALLVRALWNRVMADERGAVLEAGISPTTGRTVVRVRFKERKGPTHADAVSDAGL